MTHPLSAYHDTYLTDQEASDQYDALMIKLNQSHMLTEMLYGVPVGLVSYHHYQNQQYGQPRSTPIQCAFD